MKNYIDIEGSEKILELYGKWPSFHDSEIISINLDRDKENGKYGPTVTVKIHGFTITNEIDERGHYKIKSHQLENLKYMVKFTSHLTCDLSFKCGSIWIVSLERGVPEKSIYA
ncbi:MAG: Imm50 family immunity protein [Pyrinomonadaceae bacterium]